MGQIKKAVLAHAIFAAATIGAVTFAMQAGGGLSGTDRYIPERDNPPADMAEMMACWEKSSKVDAPHKFLKPFVGNWDTKTRMWMAPDAPPTEEMGTAQFELVLGGRFAKQTWSGSMMGMPAEGIGYTGYDTIRKQYTSVWLSNLGTSMMTMTGNLDPKGNVLTQVGVMDEPTTGEYGKAAKWATRWHSDDHFTLEGYEILYGEPFKVFEVEYRRKK